eukprot:gene6147-8323_t
MAMGLGAEVVVLERSIPRMAYIDEVTNGRVITRYSSIGAIDEEVVKADVVIGAVLVPGAEAPKLIKKSHLKSMKPGSVLVDVAIDQGGCFETSHATTHEDPTYTVDGVVHYCVANMPGAAPRTSSEALNNATLPFGLALANHGLEALRKDPHLARGLNVLKGEITYPAVAEAMGLSWSDPFGVWAKGEIAHGGVAVVLARSEQTGSFQPPGFTPHPPAQERSLRSRAPPPSPARGEGYAVTDAPLDAGSGAPVGAISMAFSSSAISLSAAFQSSLSGDLGWAQLALILSRASLSSATAIFTCSKKPRSTIAAPSTASARSAV